MGTHIFLVYERECNFWPNNDPVEPISMGLSLVSVLYVSRSVIPESEAEAAVDKIIGTARSRNPIVGITGALLFTGKHFAQVIEGTPRAIDEMMAALNKDVRHDQIIITAREQIAERRFGEWSMAYSGSSQFVARHVTRLLAEPIAPNQCRSAKWLEDLLWEFSEGHGSR